ncbi:MAG: hypothetical protein IJ794_20025 [Lachnospiraceae bacterium]|nr:hypothetical protein [Lachnospiraceae bacterium]
MGKFKHIDNEDMCPDISQHVEYAEVYRATKSDDELHVEDFLPWNIEHTNQRKTFKNQFKQSQYGLSVFTDLGSLKNTVERFPALSDSINAYAKGFTTITRGISLKENAMHHVEYFLYDYEYNSPKDDFEIVEVREKHG